MKFYLIPVLFIILFSCVYSQVPYYYYPMPSGTTNNLNSADVSGNTFFAVGNAGTLLKSTNSGYNWSLVNLGSSNNFNDIFSYYLPWSYYKIYIVGNNGTIFISTNSGTNFIFQSTGVSYNLNSANVRVYFDTVCFAVGSNGIILKEIANSVKSVWTIIPSGTTANLNSIYTINNYCWIAGSGGVILTSFNGGSNWTSRASGVSTELKSVWFKDYINGFAVGANGVILRSTNSGMNWYQQTSGTTQNLNRIFQLSKTDTSKLCIVGNNTVLFSSNGGTNWSADVNVPTANISSGAYIEESDDMIFTAENGKLYRRNPDTVYHPNNTVLLRPNKISSMFSKKGVFNQNVLASNSPGFEWPKDSGKYAIFSTGLNISAFTASELRMAACSYKGEYLPGYCTNGNFHTNLYFKIYRVNKSDNALTNWDWANWGQMVPYGAPFIDVNNNGTYEPAIDTPGVKNAKETIFLCMTDANPNSHLQYEGFGGGTAPLGAEIHMTAWAYESADLQNVQFVKYDIINKSLYNWSYTKIGLFCDPDLGNSDNDYIGCDTLLNLGYCYNASGTDPVYGAYPPAVGITLLRGSVLKNVTPNVNLGMTSFTYCTNPSTLSVLCETDPEDVNQAVNILSGLKKDSTPFLDPSEFPFRRTKICYSGDPETYSGWTEYGGAVQNCGGDTTGIYTAPTLPGDRRFILSSGSDLLTMNPGDTQKFVIAQLIARGSSNLNSVTVLKNLTSQVRNFYETHFPIGIKQISSVVPDKFCLYQNYPNPFNPVTSIRYNLPKSSMVTLKVYDVLGREVETLVNDFQQAGMYETKFPSNSNPNLASGVYFYKLITGDFVAVKRMLLVK